MAKQTIKILWCEHHKICKYVWPFFNIVNERVNKSSSVSVIGLTYAAFFL